MTFPLIVLGVLSVIGGWIGIPHVLGAVLPGHPPNVLEHWLEPAVAAIQMGEVSHVLEWALMGISVSIAGLSAWFAYDTYIKHPERASVMAKKLGPVYHLVSDKYRVDEMYFAGIINPLVEMSKGLWVYVDVNFIDKITYFVSDVVKGAGTAFKSLQNGNLQQYAMYISIGLAATVLFVLMG